MPMVMRSFTKKDLKYYYFYYRIGCKNKRCPKCLKNGIRQETRILAHVFDGAIVAEAEKILRDKIIKLRFQDWEHADRVCAAAVRYFHPPTHKVGKVVASWNREDLERLAPVKRRSKIIWYVVRGTVSYRHKDGAAPDRDFRSKSFPAASPREAEEKARRWLECFEKRLKNKKPVHYFEANIFYANRNRGLFSLPDTGSNLLVRRSSSSAKKK